MMHVEETEELVPYLGRNVPRRGFRAFIYHKDGRKKLAESYDEFDLFTHSNEWFASVEEAQSANKSVRKKSVKADSISKSIVKNGLIEEDFLPNDTGE